MIRKLFFAGILFLLGMPKLHSQEYMTDKGSSMISGTFLLSSYGGDLYLEDGERVTSITFAPSYSYFVAKHFFLGANLGLSYNKVGEHSMTTIGIGPKLGLTIGNGEARTIPFFSLGYNYQHYSVSSGVVSLHGSDIALGAGMIFQAKDHLGITVEAEYHFTSLGSNGNYDWGDQIMLGVGLTGLLY